MSKKIISVNCVGRPYIVDVSKFLNNPYICRADKSCYNCRAYVTTGGAGGGEYPLEDVEDVCAFGHIKEFNPNHTKNHHFKKEYYKMIVKLKKERQDSCTMVE